MDDHDDDSTMRVLRIGNDELLIRRRYETLSIINDIMIALWFTVGSAFFFWESTITAGTWLFLAGSIELIIRPAIRLTRQVHLRRFPSAGQNAYKESDQDF
ncbi:hypothetical protein EIL87_25500 [Saccharopolyspora rhizosphaerae]|uniref:YrhK domain-containing protein n=1 Tax=Saccharopolyspora rhizosphaerae TaxID=2492662 RepID=A0A426JIL4_9PSEU|nr:YrhK family protein [Saccharopolyspora rhizosphaerae]RRO13015.1 hypothetical protein EIL87_25500 [Saccharopolyspora rhizosphaerae]